MLSDPTGQGRLQGDTMQDFSAAFMRSPIHLVKRQSRAKSPHFHSRPVTVSCRPRPSAHRPSFGPSEKRVEVPVAKYDTSCTFPSKECHFDGVGFIHSTIRDLRPSASTDWEPGLPLSLPPSAAVLSAPTKRLSYLSPSVRLFGV